MNQTHPPFTTRPIAKPYPLKATVCNGKKKYGKIFMVGGVDQGLTPVSKYFWRSYYFRREAVDLKTWQYMPTVGVSYPEKL